jgi:hypothetical protein
LNELKLMRPITLEQEKAEREATRAELDALEALTAPLVNWIREHHDPHTELHISWDHVWLRQDLMSIPFPYSER